MCSSTSSLLAEDLFRALSPTSHHGTRTTVETALRSQMSFGFSEKRPTQIFAEGGPFPDMLDDFAPFPDILDDFAPFPDVLDDFAPFPDMLDDFEDGPFVVRAQSAVGISARPPCTRTAEGAHRSGLLSAEEGQGASSCKIGDHRIMPLPPRLQATLASRMRSAPSEKLWRWPPILLEAEPSEKEPRSKPNRRMVEPDHVSETDLARTIARYRRIRQQADRKLIRLETIMEQRERRRNSSTGNERRSSGGPSHHRAPSAHARSHQTPRTRTDSSVTVSSRTTMALNMVSSAAQREAGVVWSNGDDGAGERRLLLQEAKEKLDRAFMRKECDPEWRNQAMTLNMSEWESLCERPFEGPRREDSREGRETMGGSDAAQPPMDWGAGAARHDIRELVYTQAGSPEERLRAKQSGGEQRYSRCSDAARPERRGAGRAWFCLLYSLLGALVVGSGIGCVVYLGHHSSTPQPPGSQPPGFLEPGPPSAPVILPVQQTTPKDLSPSVPVVPVPVRSEPVDNQPLVTDPVKVIPESSPFEQTTNPAGSPKYETGSIPRGSSSAATDSSVPDEMPGAKTSAFPVGTPTPVVVSPVPATGESPSIIGSMWERNTVCLSAAMSAFDLTGATVAFGMAALLAADGDAALAAVRKDGCALEYVPERFRDDRGVVLAAVGENGFALAFASERLRDDEGVVMVAVRKSGHEALQFASKRLHGDILDRMVFACARGNRMVSVCALSDSAVPLSLDMNENFIPERNGTQGFGDSVCCCIRRPCTMEQHLNTVAGSGSNAV